MPDDFYIPQLCRERIFEKVKILLKKSELPPDHPTAVLEIEKERQFSGLRNHRTRVRVRFYDCMTVELTYLSNEHVSSLYADVRFTLKDKDRAFILYIEPPTVHLDPTQTFREAGLTPWAIVLFRWADGCIDWTEPYLSEDHSAIAEPFPAPLHPPPPVAMYRGTWYDSVRQEHLDADFKSFVGKMARDAGLYFGHKNRCTDETGWRKLEGLVEVENDNGISQVHCSGKVVYRLGGGLSYWQGGGVLVLFHYGLIYVRFPEVGWFIPVDVLEAFKLAWDATPRASRTEPDAPKPWDHIVINRADRVRGAGPLRPSKIGIDASVAGGREDTRSSRIGTPPSMTVCEQTPVTVRHDPPIAVQPRTPRSTVKSAALSPKVVIAGMVSASSSSDEDGVMSSPGFLTVGGSSDAMMRLGSAQPRSSDRNAESSTAVSDEDVGSGLDFTILFPRSVFYNIAYRCADATMDDVKEAATAVGLHQTIMSWPAGYGTIVGPEGMAVGDDILRRMALGRFVLYSRLALGVADGGLMMGTDGEARLEGVRVPRFFSGWDNHSVAARDAEVEFLRARLARENAVYRANVLETFAMREFQIDLGDFQTERDDRIQIIFTEQDAILEWLLGKYGMELDGCLAAYLEESQSRVPPLAGYEEVEEGDDEVEDKIQEMRSLAVRRLAELTEVVVEVSRKWGRVGAGKLTELVNELGRLWTPSDGVLHVGAVKDTAEVCREVCEVLRLISVTLEAIEHDAAARDDVKMHQDALTKCVAVQHAALKLFSVAAERATVARKGLELARAREEMGDKNREKLVGAHFKVALRDGGEEGVRRFIAEHEELLGKIKALIGDKKYGELELMMTAGRPGLEDALWWE
ncbi:hypothetical protein HK097_009325, partial [Rhizophlyctis rosea]